MKRPEALAAAGLLIAVAFVFFYPTILGQALYWGSDISAFYAPIHELLGDCLRRWDFSALVWNPSLQGGYPLLAEGQIGAFYPLNWLTLLCFSPAASVSASIVISYLATALATCSFLRSIGASWGGAVLGAIAFAFGGFAVCHVIHVPVLVTVPWLPIVLTLVERGLLLPAPSAGPDLRWFVAAGLAWGVQVFAGHPQVPFMTLLLAAAYTAFRLLSWGSATIVLRVRHVIAAVTTLAFVGVSVAAVHLLPLLELANQSFRVGAKLPYEHAALYSMPPSQLATALLPFVFGGPREYQGPWSFAELGFYSGVVTLFLAAAALSNLSRSRHVAFFAAVVGVAVVLALGDSTPLFRLTHVLPGFGAFRAPARFGLLIDFGLATLTAFGFDLVAAAAPDTRRFRTGLAVAALVLGLAVGALGTIITTIGPLPAALLLASGAWLLAAGRIPATTWSALGLLLLVVDLRSFAARVHAPWLVPPSRTAWRNEALAWVAEQPKNGRVYVLYSDKPWALDTNQSLRYGLDDIGGYSALYLRQWRGYLQAFWWTGQARRVLLSLANVRYVVDDWQGTQAPSRTRRDVTFRLNFPVAMVGAEGVARAVTYRVAPRPVQALAFVTRLQDAGALAPGAEAARLTVLTADGRARVFPLRTGIETAERIEPDGPEAAYLGPAMDGLTQAELLYGRVPLEPPASVTGLRLEYVAPHGQLWVQGLSLVGSDSAVTGVSPFMEEGYRAVHRGPHSTVYENTEALPRAYVAHAVTQALDLQRIVDALLSLDFRPGEAVVLEDAAAPAPKGVGPSSARIESDRPTEVRIAAVLRGDGYVVLSDIDYPGWHAFVDGQAARIYRANGVFRAVHVPDGAHQVRFVYRPTWLRFGAVWSGLTLVAVVLFLGLRRGREAE